MRHHHMQKQVAETETSYQTAPHSQKETVDLKIGSQVTQHHVSVFRRLSLAAHAPMTQLANKFPSIKKSFVSLKIIRTGVKIMSYSSFHARFLQNIIIFHLTPLAILPTFAPSVREGNSQISCFYILYISVYIQIYRYRYTPTYVCEMLVKNTNIKTF